jgi:tight adherence protein B
MSVVLVTLIGLAVVVLVMPARTVIRRLRGPVTMRLPSVDPAAVVRHPRRLLAAAVVVGALLGLALGGPVAAFVLAVYAGLSARGLVRRTGRKSAAEARARSLDDLSALAADLRAGLPPTPSPALSAAGLPPVSSAAGLPPVSSGRLPARVDAVWALADQTGAPAADLVERIEADARAADRARASASAEAAGAQATAMLLAALPVGGIGLGFGLGADPLRILFHTPIGGACAVAAVVLQAAGLLWTERLTAGASR